MARTVPSHDCRDHLDWIGGHMPYECVVCYRLYDRWDFEPGGQLAWEPPEHGLDEARAGDDGPPAATETPSLELRRQHDGSWILTRGDTSIAVGDDGMRRIAEIVRYAPCKDDDFNIEHGYGRQRCMVCDQAGERHVGNVDPDQHTVRYGHAPVVRGDGNWHVYMGDGTWGLYEPESYTIDESPRW